MTPEKTPTWNWKEFALVFVAFLVLAAVGVYFIDREPFHTLWPLAAGFLVAATWQVWKRYFSNRRP